VQAGSQEDSKATWDCHSHQSRKIGTGAEFARDRQYLGITAMRSGTVKGIIGKKVSLSDSDDLDLRKLRSIALKTDMT
jgi:hypothetical protein